MRKCLVLFFLVVLTTSFSIVRETLWVVVASYDFPKESQVLVRVVAAPTRKEAQAVFFKKVHRIGLDRYPLSPGIPFYISAITENKILRK